MKKLRLALLTLAFVLLSFSFVSLPQVAAHELKESNGISGVLHIEPDDNPRAGQPTVIQMSFGDENDAFDLTHCDCKVAIKADDKTIHELSLRPPEVGVTLVANATVEFPDAGVYDLVVSGASTNATFKDFSLDYLVRVSSSTQAVHSADNSFDTLLIGGGALVILGLLADSNIRRGGRYNRVTPKPSKPILVKKGARK